MAVTYATTAAASCIGGLEIRVVTLTTSLGASDSNDYSSGFALGANKAKFGLNSILGVVGLSSAKGNGATNSDALVFTWDHVNGKLRAWADFDTPTEESGTNLTAGSTVQFLAIGV